MPSPYTAAFSLQHLSAERAEDFWRVTDSVARERRYLAFLEIPQAASAEYARSQLASQAPHLLLLDGEQVVGWCDVTPNRLPIYQHGGTLGMGLLPRYRGMGLGGWLMENTLRLAEQRGFRRLELTVHEDNLNAIKLYEKHGFLLEGRKRRAITIDGRCLDVLMMARLTPHESR
ncbi:GNAT family N-acetyltransferase [Chromobacterium phragmitis]|uniref:GNAT family N-acetyltransferase n=1 Tax=Chromobacterium phragmitis TaxID=2202141 RepID=A0A344UPB4_9NEIS|nr:GNAT family N-acetyltransferase [Chromobacterium phragmitis]AXE32724.1 GNAT family N-acetyltransferase [Chromobacterium phragmitis]AXE37112.1 GNAT family N-acetyltransferase [Chromobacterium phragmitis]